MPTLANILKQKQYYRRAFAREMKSLPKQIKHSLTYDQGSEMTEHKLFSKDVQIKIY